VLEKHKALRERKAAELQTKESEAKYRSFFENSQDAILLPVTDGVILAANPAACKMFEMTPEEIVGTGRLKVVDMNDPRLQPLLEKRRKTGYASGELTFLRKNGEKFPGEITASRFVDGNGKERSSMIIRDISERKIAEEKIATTSTALEHALKDLTKVMNSSLDMICAVNEAGYFIQVSAACQSILGYTPDELIGTLLFDYVYSEDLEKTEISSIQVMEGKSLTHFENRYVHKNGSLVNLSWSTKWDEHEHIRYGVARDVTEQVRWAKQVEKSQEQYRQIVETAQEGIWVMDENLTTTFVNNKLCELLEYTREEMKGKHIHFFLDEEGKTSVSNFIKRKKEGKTDYFPVKYITKSKKELWVNVSANPLFDDTDQYRGSLAMLTDITSQKRIEEENKKLAMVAERTVNSVIVTDINGKIIWVNKGFERITEYSFSEVLGKTPGSLLQGEETDPAAIAHMNTCLSERKGFRLDILNYTKTGRPYWADIEVAPLLDENGVLTGFMAIEQDITNRKKSEQETINLISTLQKKNKDLQQFSYIVSHNLRAPIAKLLGLASIIQVEETENKFLMEQLNIETNKLDEVVKDINIIVSARKLEKEIMDDVDLEIEIQNVLQVLETEILKTRASIIHDVTETKSVFTIKSYLYSILYNLISNALKYRHPNLQPEVSIRSSVVDSTICLSVKDNGMGIDLSKNKSKIFGLYKRFHGKSIPGKGVGLHLVKTHVETLGGRIEVKSQLNKGTEFKIYLPTNYDAITNY
jgi:PAS domain S-box-containing protein